MKNSKRVKLIFSLIFILAISSNSLACSCIGKETVKEAIKNSDVVFKGEVISKEEIVIHNKLRSRTTDYHFYKFTFKVEKIYKGKIKNEIIEIVTGVGHGDCGFKFIKGKKYVVYSVWKNKYFNSGEKVKKYLYTHVCTRTTSNAIEEENKINQYCKHCSFFKACHPGRSVRKSS